MIRDSKLFSKKPTETFSQILKYPEFHIIEYSFTKETVQLDTIGIAPYAVQTGPTKFSLSLASSVPMSKHPDINETFEVMLNGLIYKLIPYSVNYALEKSAFMEVQISGIVESITGIDWGTKDGDV